MNLFVVVNKESFKNSRNPGSGQWSKSLPKSNWLVLGPRLTFPKISPESVHNFLRYLAYRRTNRHRQTHKPLRKHHLYEGRNRSQLDVNNRQVGY